MTWPNPDPLYVPEEPVKRTPVRSIDSGRTDAVIIAVGVIAILALWALNRPQVAPAPTPTPSASPTAVVAALAGASAGVTGTATWYRYHQGQAAAGPALRAALGKGWRGSTVRACHDGACVRVVLTDWCLCGHGRVIDLDSRDFRTLTADDEHKDGRLGLGVIPVRVTLAGRVVLPATDTESEP
jgi:hypothetical protein